MNKGAHDIFALVVIFLRSDWQLKHINTQTIIMN
jgi:hypothetical protein